jgi:hypothetical protein
LSNRVRKIVERKKRGREEEKGRERKREEERGSYDRGYWIAGVVPFKIRARGLQERREELPLRGAKNGPLAGSCPCAVYSATQPYFYRTRGVTQNIQDSTHNAEHTTLYSQRPQTGPHSAEHNHN